jgi:cell wall-associated NlpC family hydrolase
MRTTARHGRSSTLLVLLGMLFPLLGAQSARAGEGAATQEQIALALNVALRQQGEPYVYGAEGPDSFDCSGLVQFAYAKAGIVLPRVSADQARFFDRLPRKRDILPGDLMAFFDADGVYHVGLWTGRWLDGRRLMIHAPRTGELVQVSRAWTHEWFAATLRIAAD